MEGYGSNFIKFPQLSKYDIKQILPAEEIYRMLVQWLSDARNQNESKSDNRNNNEKIISKGFDIKRSFRPNMK